MDTYKCPLDKTVTVIELTDDDVTSMGSRSLFHGFGYAFTMLNTPKPVIIFKGSVRDEPWFTKAHEQAIFAHELGHIRGNTEDEEEADARGLDILAGMGLDDAYQLLWDRAEDVQITRS
jgi:hypothetical protein